MADLGESCYLAAHFQGCRRILRHLVSPTGCLPLARSSPRPRFEVCHEFAPLEGREVAASELVRDDPADRALPHGFPQRLGKLEELHTAPCRARRNANLRSENGHIGRFLGLPAAPPPHPAHRQQLLERLGPCEVVEVSPEQVDLEDVLALLLLGAELADDAGAWQPVARPAGRRSERGSVIEFSSGTLGEAKPWSGWRGGAPT